MSQYHPDHTNYYPASSTYPVPQVPQYTQAQISEYYAQYGCYPQQPYEVASDTIYAPQASVAATGYGPTAANTSSAYSYGGGGLTVQEQPRSARSTEVGIYTTGLTFKQKPKPKVNSTHCCHLYTSP